MQQWKTHAELCVNPLPFSSHFSFLEAFQKPQLLISGSLVQEFTLPTTNSDNGNDRAEIYLGLSSASYSRKSRCVSHLRE